MAYKTIDNWRGKDWHATYYRVNFLNQLWQNERGKRFSPEKCWKTYYTVVSNFRGSKTNITEWYDLMNYSLFCYYPAFISDKIKLLNVILRKYHFKKISLYENIICVHKSLLFSSNIFKRRKKTDITLILWRTFNTIKTLLWNVLYDERIYVYIHFIKHIKQFKSVDGR